MIPHDPALDAAYGKQAWEPLVRLTFTDAAGNALPTPPPVLPAGRYTADASRWPRQTVDDLTLPTAITPAATASPVSPYGGLLLVDVGVRFLGVARWFRLATLDVTETRVNRPEGTITVKAASHEARIDEDRVESRTATSAGKGTALVTSLVRRTLGATHPVRNLVPDADDPAYAAGAFSLDGGTWQTVEAIGDASGFESWFDHMGALVIAPTPVKGTPAADLVVGQGGQVTGYESTRGWAYNRVAVPYETPAGARIVGLWEDTNPASATRVTGPYGRHTYVADTVRVDTLPTQAVANRAAATQARRQGAPFRSASLRTIPAPWIEPGDTVAVEFLGGLSEHLLVVAHEFPLDGLDVATVTAADDTYTRDLGSSLAAAPLPA